MKVSFREAVDLNDDNLALLNRINSIIEEYAEQGYKLTLRQLYYQLVSRDVIPNTTKSYAKISSLLVKGRMAGLVDWESIEDRLRVPYLPYYVLDIDDAIKDTISHYRLDRMKGQDVHIELWVEKDALSSVLKRVTRHYHIRLMVNRGYSSCTAMHDAYLRLSNAVELGQRLIVLYLGDHDPSGLDMVRDIKSRLVEFGLEDVLVVPIGLTSEQVEKYKPPPNPAKITDPRAKSYIERYGPTSWEVDALKPDVLHSLVRSAVESFIDMNLFNLMLKKEESDKLKLVKMVEELDESSSDEEKEE